MGWLHHLLQTHHPLLDLGSTWSPEKSKEMSVLHSPQSCSEKGKWINLPRVALRQDAGIEAYSEKLLWSDEILVGMFALWMIRWKEFGKRGPCSFISLCKCSCRTEWGELGCSTDEKCGVTKPW